MIKDRSRGVKVDPRGLRWNSAEERISIRSDDRGM